MKSCLMQRASMFVWNITVEESCLDFGKTLAFSRPSVESLRRKFFASLRPPPKEVPDALGDVPCFADVEASKGKLLGCHRCVGIVTPLVMPLCWSPAKRAHKRSLSSLLTRHINQQCFCHCEGSSLLYLR